MLPFSRSFLSQTRNLVHFRETQIRVFSSSRKKDVFTGEIPPEDEPPKPKYTKKTKDQQLKINLVDIKGTILGLKTRHEAQMIAKKNNWILVEDDSTKKIPSMRLVDPRVKQIKEVHLEENDEEICDADSVGVGHKSHNKKMPQKQMIFNAKITEHDLRVKLNHIKKWVATGHETIVRASSNFDCLEKIKSIDKILEETFNRPALGIKINQKRVNSRDLKLTIVPYDLSLAAELLKEVKKNEQFNVDDIDPNQLLSDDSLLDKLSKDKK